MWVIGVNPRTSEDATSNSKKRFNWNCMGDIIRKHTFPPDGSGLDASTEALDVGQNFSS